jgi:hypothetical protein
MEIPDNTHDHYCDLVKEKFVNGKDVMLALKSKLDVKTDTELASRLGVTSASVTYWNNRPNVTSTQFASLLYKAYITATKKLHVTAIRPIVEFYKIQMCQSSQRAQNEVFSIRDTRGINPFKEGLKNDLDNSHGVYVFFDSRGKAIYAGKAKRQSIWTEMNLAFNRSRGRVQKIKRIDYPESRVAYKTAEEKSRQIKNIEIPIHELAAYISAYHVVDGMIDELEALLVRSFANDLINIKMERFKQQRKRKRKKKR